MATEAAARAFFSSPQFAVVGASSDPKKFGHKSALTSPSHHSLPLSLYTRKLASSYLMLINGMRIVFTWYTHHSLPVTPINPSSSSITARPPTASSPSELQTYTTLPSVSALPAPSTTSASIITPPAVTKKVLQEAKEAGIAAVWLQPGSFDKEGLEFALKEWEGRAVGGEGGRGGEGWCVLVDGERAMKGAEKERKQRGKM